MSFKQWSAVLSLACEGVIAIWLIYDFMGTATDPGAAAVAAKLLWAMLAMIVINILAAIGSAIVGSIVTRSEFRDERADERDKSVYARSMRNACYVVSIGGVLTLLLTALGYPPVAATYAIFIGGLLGGATASISQIHYYRVG